MKTAMINLYSVARGLAPFVLVTFLFSAIYGIIYPGGDMYLIIPHLLQVQGRASFATDLYFSTVATSYASVVGLLALWSRLLPLKVVVIGIQVLSNALLFYSVWRLSKHLIRARPSVLVIFLIVTITGVRFLGNIVSGSSYHPQFTSFAFLALALPLMIERRFLWAVLALGFCAIFHPLIGLYSLGLLMVSLLFLKPAWKEVLIVMVMMAVVFLIAIWPSVQSSGMQVSANMWKKYVSILIYIRAPHHHLPLIWRRAELLSPILVALFGLSLVRDIGKGILPWLCCLLLLVLAGIVNNNYFHVPVFVIANPLKMGVVILLLFWCLATKNLYEMIAEGRWYSTVLLLCSQNLTMFLILSTAASFVRLLTSWDRFALPLGTIPRTLINDLIGLVVCFFLIHVSGQAVQPLYLLKRHLVFFGLGSACVFFLSRHLKHIKLEYIAIVLLTANLGGWSPFCTAFPKARPIVINRYNDTAWVEVCKVVDEKLPPEACVVIPPHKEDFHIHAKRSCFVDLKHFPFHPLDAIEWANRMIELNVLKIEPKDLGKLDRRTGFNWYGYNELSIPTFLNIRSKYPFVGYCIVARHVTLSLPLLYENEGYRLYSLEYFEYFVPSAQ